WPMMLGRFAPTWTSTSASASTRLPSAISAWSSAGRLACNVATRRAAICAFCETCTFTVAGVQLAVKLACALQLASHSASTVGGFTQASHFGACHVPAQLAWQVASQLPLHWPPHCPTQRPCASLAEHWPLHWPVQRPSQLPVHWPWQ